MYDAVIIGTGPAGISAALNLKIHQKNFLLLGDRNLSEKLSKAELVQNYPGFLEGSGEKLREKMQKQLEQMEISVTEAMVNSILPFGTHYALMAGSEYYETRTVLLATGIVFAATLPGEQEFVGRGVSYCATCDGGLYRGKTVAVLCNNKRFEPEVKYLAELAEKVYFFPQYADASDFGETVLRQKTVPARILGEQKVQTIVCRDETELSVDGIFCLRDSVSLASLLPEIETEEGHIRVNRRMETSLPGVFAAGDCTGRPYQYAKAVGEGNVAAHGILEYLEQTK